MKFAVILPDGAADEPVPELGGRTPLEAAHKPHIDSIAAAGRQGIVVTVPPEFSPGSDVATLSLFGYDPRTDHPGRAPLEAAAQGIAAGPDETIFRCNLVTVSDGRMRDFTAGHISQDEAAALIGALNACFSESGLHFHSGVSYRNLLIAKAPAGPDLKCAPPHDFPDQPVGEHMPTGRGADWVAQVMDRARPVLASHAVNADRCRRGENPATDIWLWGQGRAKPLQKFSQRFGLRAAAIAAVDLIRGIARSVHVEVINVPGATGYLDTDYAAKGRAACAALDRYDLIFVHVEAPDEAGHLGDAAAKVAAIEEIDRHVAGPLLENLRRYPRWRILVAPDHPTPVQTRIHSRTPPPFCVAGTGIAPAACSGLGFSERKSLSSGIRVDPGFELLGKLIAGHF